MMTLPWLDLPLIWAGLIAFAVLAYVVLDGFDLGIGILFAVEHEAHGPRRDGELHRADLGRQRDLAGAGRRRPVRGVPAGLRGHHAGAVSDHHRHAAGADLSRRGVRVPLPRALARRPRRLGLRVLRRLDGGGVVPGADARRAAAGHPRGQPRLCRRLVGLADAIHAAVRPRRGDRLRAARRDLAGLAHRGRVAAPLPAPCAAGWARRRWR